MKKKFLLIISILLIITTTGCAKISQSITVNKNKSVDLVIIEAVKEESLTDEQKSTMITSLNLDKIKSSEYSLENYNSNGYIGYKITRHFPNIDKISSKEEVVADLSISNITNQQYLFTVKKGLFKNTYYGDFYSSDLNSLKNNIDSSNNIYSSSEIDIGFNLSIPTKIGNNNAGYVSGDLKNANWPTYWDKPIQFEFTLYNYKTIFILTALFVIIIIIFIYKFVNRKKRKLTLESYNNNSLF